MEHQEELAAERVRIDAIDTEILGLLNERMACALRVGRIKEALGWPLHDPARERLIYERLRARNAEIGGNVPDIAVTAIYREIISACRNAEHPMRVAFLGPSGTNTQEAAVQYFGSAFEPLPCGTVDEVCATVARGAGAAGADYGVIAVENSTQGIVSANLDLLANSGITICAEIALVIHHCLLANTDLGQITKVYSHEQALAQCRGWLAGHLPGATLVPVTSTARGAELAAQEPGAAGISAGIAANIYGLQIVAANIEDLSNNKTRFFVVGMKPPANLPTGRDKTSIAFQVPHKPGALVEVLAVFQRQGINLTMIQSRPSRQEAWEYRFFADLQAHSADASLNAALEELGQHTITVKLLGSYPEAS